MCIVTKRLKTKEKIIKMSCKILFGTLESEGVDIEQYQESVNKRLDDIKNYKNTIKLLLNAHSNGDDITFGYDYNNYNLIIDGEETWVRWLSDQTVEKVSDYEYKVYQYYFLPEDRIGNKKEFSLELKDIVLINCTDENSVKDSSKGYILNIPSNEKYIELDGEIKVNVSKEKALENTKYIDISEQKVLYDGMEQMIEEVAVTPMQTIIKVKTVFNNLDGKDIGKTLCLDFDVYNQNEELMNVFETETKRVITYANGKQEKWEVGDVANNNFKGATMELTEYIAIGNDESIESLKIVPTVRRNNGNSEFDMQVDSSFYVDLK